LFVSFTDYEDAVLEKSKCGYFCLAFILQYDLNCVESTIKLQPTNLISLLLNIWSFSKMLQLKKSKWGINGNCDDILVIEQERVAVICC